MTIEYFLKLCIRVKEKEKKIKDSSVYHLDRRKQLWWREQIEETKNSNTDAAPLKKSKIVEISAFL